MASWKKTMTSPFKKASTFFNHHQQSPPDHKPQSAGRENSAMALQGEVMACGYEDVQVMWSILDKSRPPTTTNSSN